MHFGAQSQRPQEQGMSPALGGWVRTTASQAPTSPAPASTQGAGQFPRPQASTSPGSQPTPCQPTAREQAPGGS